MPLCSHMLLCPAAEAMWRSTPAVPPAGSAGPQSQAGGAVPVPEPSAGRAALGSPAGPAYMWTGSTRSLLPALRPGHSAEVPLQVCTAGVLGAYILAWLHCMEMQRCALLNPFGTWRPLIPSSNFSHHRLGVPYCTQTSKSQPVYKVVERHFYLPGRNAERDETKIVQYRMV